MHLLARRLLQTTPQMYNGLIHGQPNPIPLVSSPAGLLSQHFLEHHSCFVFSVCTAWPLRDSSISHPLCDHSLIRMCCQCAELVSRKILWVNSVFISWWNKIYAFLIWTISVPNKVSCTVCNSTFDLALLRLKCPITFDACCHVVINTNTVCLNSHLACSYAADSAPRDPLSVFICHQSMRWTKECIYFWWS